MRPLTAREKWSYAIGNMPYSIKDAAFVNFVVFYYTQVQGLSGTLAGLSMFIALSWDAVSDPVVGSWSDRVRSRWGRRHPLILGGGLTTALMFIALFNPPEGLGQLGAFAWLTAVAIILRTCLTINYIPFQAMGAELSKDYDERTDIAKARVAMGWLAGMILPAVAFVFIFNTTGDTDGRLIADNYHAYGLLSTVLAVAATLVCIWGTRTLVDRLPQADPDAPMFSLRETIADFKSALANRNFRFAMGAKLAFGMAAGVYTTLALYMGTYFWEFSSVQLAALVFPTALGTLVAFAIMTRMGSRWDKPQLLAGAALVLALNNLWLIGARLLGILPENGHAIIYPLMLLSTAIAVIAVVATHALAASLTADILDENEVHTGKRQEGVFFAAGAFVLKATSGFGALITGVVIDIAGIEPGTAPGAVSDTSLVLLGSFSLGIISLLCATAYAFTLKIRLSRADHAALQAKLALNRQPA